MKYLLLAAMLLLQLSQSHAQQFSCGTEAADQALRARNPEYNALRKRADSIMNIVQTSGTQQGNNGSSPLVVNGVHYIPVVVHVFHTGQSTGTSFNPTDQQINSYINILNQAFSATHPNVPGPGNGGQDIGIQFVLAQRDPNCNPTNGIVRINTSTAMSPAAFNEYSSFGIDYNGWGLGVPYDSLAAISHWNNLEYYNIFIVKGIIGAGGFAFYPSGSATIYDATVIPAYEVVAPAQGVYTISHELGHAFYLHHTFTGANGATCPANTNCASDGDMICDTDPHLENTNGCDPSATNPCTGQPYGQVVMNYMSYSCANHFTAGQKTRMLNALNTLRAPLDASLGGTSLALVPPGPTLPSATISISTGQMNYCAGAQAIFTATTTNGGVTPVYQWKVNGVNVGSNSPVFTSTTLSNGDIISCHFTSSINPSCIAVGTAISNNIQVTINSTIAPSIVISASTTTVCSGAQVTLTANAFNHGTFVPGFYWHVNGQLAYSTATGSTVSSYTYMPSNGDVVTCELYASTGCQASPWYNSNAIAITTTPSISPTISITVSDTAVCSGSTITLNATYTNGGTVPPYIYWNIINDLSGAFAMGPGPIVMQVDTSFDLIASLGVANTGGVCYSNTVAISNIFHITADTPVAASVTIATTDTNFCHGSMVNFIATPTNGGSTPAYNWKVNGMNAGVSTSTFGHIPDDNDVIVCELTSSEACLVTNPVTSNAITVHKFDTVSASVVFLQGAGAMCEGDTIILTANYVNLDTNTIATRQWLVNGSQTGNTDTLMHVLVPGSNEIQYIASFLHTPHCMVANTVGFSDTIAAYPLPATPVITDFGTHFGSNYPNGQNQWYEVSTGLLTGETNQLFYPSVSGFYYDVVTVNGCSSIPSDTVQFIAPNSVNGLYPTAKDFSPNPSVNGVFLTPEYLVGREATVVNSLGQTIRKIKLDEHLSLRELSSGIYFVRITARDLNRSYKLIIKR